MHQFWTRRGYFEAENFCKKTMGPLHRKGDLPAAILERGEKRWYINGKLHRINGPAIIYSNGDEEWYKWDELHREDGPAVSFLVHNATNRMIEWRLDGFRYTLEEFVKLTPYLKTDGERTLFYLQWK